jgi:RNA polymerase sigma factor (sigma-70 family)
VVAVDAATLENAAEAACRAGLRAGLREVDARDLAQEALVRALTSAQPPGGVPLAAWVYGIARNLGRDHAKSPRSREVLVAAIPDPEHDGDPTTVLAVRRAVHELPDPLREVVTLHELEELSLRETAETLAIPFDTAKDRLRRAREQLRERLGDADYAAERKHTRRRAGTAGAAIVVAALAAMQRSEAATAAATVAGGFVVRAWVAAMVGAVLVAGGFTAGRLTASRPTERQVAVVASGLERAHEPVPAPAAEPTPAPVPAVAPVSSPTVSLKATPRSAEDDPARATERLLLDRARTALQRGLPDEALVALMTHERKFPSGAFAEERDVLLIEAYLAANNSELARRRVDRYRADYPTGALRSRVDTLAAQLTTSQ